ncbi:hypothetical protein Sgou_32470 [Streptomyces gougerotii]|uniref:Protein kinase domain-containing protein n=1 Tax=Streptomyces gougerotii TaxID=53448 RepID=A0ABQ1D7N4_9ACTN|nr:hypothetical protein [Streptomyces gougerotii]GFH78577.1 hypothetical protein Sgou_32470 [Streptomyces gougerotii]
MAAPRAAGGPDTPLEAERARQARMTVVGAVTERWAPEQAGPVHDRWQLAAPVGPAADLWALGALLFSTVQGHAPYPEESVAELVQMVLPPSRPPSPRSAARSGRSWSRCCGRTPPSAPTSRS